MLPGQADYIAQLQALDPIISIDSGRSCSLELRRATEAPSSMAVLSFIRIAPRLQARTSRGTETSCCNYPSTLLAGLSCAV